MRLCARKAPTLTMKQQPGFVSRIRRGAAVTRCSPQCRRSRPSSSLGAREPDTCPGDHGGEISCRVTRSSTRPSSPRACVVPSFPRACLGTFRKHGIMQPKAAALRSPSPSHHRQPPFTRRSPEHENHASSPFILPFTSRKNKNPG